MSKNHPIWFTASEARKIVRVSQRQLDYWDERGLVQASVRRDRGKGVERRYSYTDLVKLQVVKQLRDAGLSLQRIRKAVNMLKCRDPRRDPLADDILITDGNRLYRITSDHNVLQDILAGGQLAFSVVFLGKLEAKVRKKIGQQRFLSASA